MKKRILLTILLAAMILNVSQSTYAMSETNELSKVELVKSLAQKYGWEVDGSYTIENLQTIQQAGSIMEKRIAELTGKDGRAWIQKYMGNAVFHINGKLINLARQLKICGMVFPDKDIYLPARFTVFVAVHELAHVLDNNMGGEKPAVWFGGGAADQMLTALGGHPEQVPFPYFFDREDYIARYAGPESWPYYMNGGKNPADDFTNTFLVVIVGAELPVPHVLELAPKRLAWMSEYIVALAAEL
jgi:hypothetical protein